MPVGFGIVTRRSDVSTRHSPFWFAFANLVILVTPVLAEWGNDLAGGVALPDLSPKVSCAITFEDDLVVAGRFAQAGGVNVTNVARWNGAEWSAMGSGLPAPKLEILQTKSKAKFSLLYILLWQDIASFKQMAILTLLYYYSNNRLSRLK